MTQTSRRAVILSGHFPHQPRRPSMLWVSDHLQKMGWHVTFVTVGYSWISRLAGDRRLATLDALPRAGRVDLGPRLTHLFGYAPIHPFSLGNGVVDGLMHPLNAAFAGYWQVRLRACLSQASLVIAESGPPVMLGPVLRRLAPNAARVYRVNDDARLLGLPAWFCRAEELWARSFTRVSSASPHLLARFCDHPNRTLDPMGLPLAELSEKLPDPFGQRTRKQAVCAGTSHLDTDALERIATACPDWQLHVLGRLRGAVPDVPNIVWHGERPLRTVLSHVAHADIGLAPYRDVPGVEYQATNSNRLMLYRHFGLPVLGPDRMCRPDLPGVVGYSDPDWRRRCESAARRPESLPDWRDLAVALAQNETTVPPLDMLTAPAMLT